MPENNQKIANESIVWLREKVFPLWSTVGFNFEEKLFVENLSFESKPLVFPSRVLVQARQIYSFAEGIRLQLIDRDLSTRLLKLSAQSIIEKYTLPSGAVLNSIDDNGPFNKDVDLYSQAFALFGFSQAYEMCGDITFKNAALKNLSYLYTERQNKAGGFTEIKDNKVLFQSNPHMHLFESALAWIKIDRDPAWVKLADELCELCLSRFIDPTTGFLVEHFDQNWQPIREDGKFVLEPGHHYEWSWLFVQYQKLNNKFDNNISRKLFELAECHGLSARKDLAYDEVWSDGEPKKLSSRFWPQSERIKAAVVLNEKSVADRAMQSLTSNFLIMDKGLWKDTRLENGSFQEQTVKASSLYHIINAISEYVQHRAIQNDE